MELPSRRRQQLFFRTVIKNTKKPIALLKSRKPAPLADDVSRSNLVHDGAVPLLTSTVALPKMNAARPFTTVAPRTLLTDALGKDSSLVEEVVLYLHALMSLQFLPTVLRKTPHLALLDYGASYYFLSRDTVREPRLELLPLK